MAVFSKLKLHTSYQQEGNTATNKSSSATSKDITEIRKVYKQQTTNKHSIRSNIQAMTNTKKQDTKYKQSETTNR